MQIAFLFSLWEESQSRGPSPRYPGPPGRLFLDKQVEKSIVSTPAEDCQSLPGSTEIAFSSTGRGKRASRAQKLERKALRRILSGLFVLPVVKKGTILLAHVSECFSFESFFHLLVMEKASSHRRKTPPKGPPGSTETAFSSTGRG